MTRDIWPPTTRPHKDGWLAVTLHEFTKGKPGRKGCNTPTGFYLAKIRMIDRSKKVNHDVCVPASEVRKSGRRLDNGLYLGNLRVRLEMDQQPPFMITTRYCLLIHQGYGNFYTIYGVEPLPEVRDIYENREKVE